MNIRLLFLTFLLTVSHYGLKASQGQTPAEVLSGQLAKDGFDRVLRAKAASSVQSQPKPQPQVTSNGGCALQGRISAEVLSGQLAKDGFDRALRAKAAASVQLQPQQYEQAHLMNQERHLFGGPVVTASMMHRVATKPKSQPQVTSNGGGCGF